MECKRQKKGFDFGINIYKFTHIRAMYIVYTSICGVYLYDVYVSVCACKPLSLSVFVCIELR